MKFPGVRRCIRLDNVNLRPNSIGIHIGLLIVNIATIVVVFLIATRLMGLIAGIAGGQLHDSLG
jgi:hypothetical protein